MCRGWVPSRAMRAGKMSAETTVRRWTAGWMGHSTMCSKCPQTGAVEEQLPARSQPAAVRPLRVHIPRRDAISQACVGHYCEWYCSVVVCDTAR